MTKSNAELANMLAIHAARVGSPQGELSPEVIDALHAGVQATRTQYPVSTAPRALRAGAGGDVFLLPPDELIRLAQGQVTRAFSEEECRAARLITARWVKRSCNHGTVTTDPLEPDGDEPRTDAEPTDVVAMATRVGWVAKGLLFVVIGLIGLEIARRGWSSEDADQGGALATIAGAPAGRVLVGVMGVGLILYAAWQLWSAFVGGVESPFEDPLDLASRIGSVGLSLVYGLLGVTGVQVAVTGRRESAGESGSRSPEGISTLLLGLPAGRFAVFAVGLVTIGVGVYHLQKGWRLGFVDDIDRSGLSTAGNRALIVLGVAGFTARSLMLFIAGALFVVAAWQHDADDAAGLDESLRALAAAPGGRLLLGATAVGLIAAGAYDSLTFRRQELAGDS